MLSLITFIATKLVGPILSPLLSPLIPSTKTQRLLTHLLVFLTLLTLLFVSSIIAYAIFYSLYIPKITHSAPLYFDYTSSSPLATTTIKNELMPGQRYDITVHLHVPESHQNLDMGNFMITASLLNNMNKTISLSKRPGIVAYRTPLARSIRTIWNSVWLVLGFSMESQRVSLLALENHVEPYEFGSEKLEVVLSTSKLMIYEAFVAIHAQFTGLRYFMYYWFVTTAIVGTGVFMALGAIWATAGWWVVRTVWMKLEMEREGNERRRVAGNHRVDTEVDSMTTPSEVEMNRRESEERERAVPEEETEDASNGVDIEESVDENDDEDEDEDKENSNSNENESDAEFVTPTMIRPEEENGSSSNSSNSNQLRQRRILSGAIKE